MKRLALVLSLAIVAQGAFLSPAFAEPRGGGGGGARGGGGGGARSAPAPRQAPQQRAPQPQRQQPQQRPSGFNVPSSDYRANPAPNRNNANNAANRNNANNAANRNNANNAANRNNANNAANRNNTTNNANRNNTVNNNNINRNVNNNNINRNVNNTTINRTVINNPVYYGGPAWGWNGGVAWAPAYGYYGGGFWGALAIGVTSAAVGAAVYGSIVANNTTYTSYQVQPSSPGATMLANYQLTQVPCGPPGLVVIYGPSNSVICATPNNLVSAGYYNLDTQTLSLTNQ